MKNFIYGVLVMAVVIITPALAFEINETRKELNDVTADVQTTENCTCEVCKYIVDYVNGNHLVCTCIEKGK